MTNIIGHRGAVRVALENTLASLERAVDMGVDSVEYDVRRTKDGVLTLHHEPFFAGLPVCEWEYESLQLVEGIAAAGLFPRFEDVVSQLGGRTFHTLEIKVGGCEEEVLATALKYLRPDEFAISSFIDSVVLSPKMLSPSVKVGLCVTPNLCQEVIDAGETHFLERPLWERIERCQADFLVLHLRMVTPELLAEAERRGIFVNVYTPNTRVDIERLLAEPRAQGIITDVPDLALSLRG